MKKRTFVAMLSAVAIVAGMVSCNSSTTNQSPDLSDQSSILEQPVAESNSHTTAITSNNSFDEAIANNEKVVLVDFWASWCGPCKMIAPNVEAIAAEMKDKVVVFKVDVDQPFVAETGLMQRYNIEAIPCLILFRNGKEISRNVGYMEKEELGTWLGKNVK